MHRAVVHLFYREEMSVEEIASILEIPEGTVSRAFTTHATHFDGN